jgi:hypothetical protein
MPSGYDPDTAKEPSVDRHLTWMMSLYSAMFEDEREDRTEAHDLAARWAASLHDLAQDLRRNPSARSHSGGVPANGSSSTCETT